MHLIAAGSVLFCLVIFKQSPSYGNPRTGFLFHSSAGRTGESEHWLSLLPTISLSTDQYETQIFRLCFGCNLTAAALYLSSYPGRIALAALILLSLHFAPDSTAESAPFSQMEFR